MMTPKMKEDLCTQILNASRQLFLSSKISEVCQEKGTQKQLEFVLELMNEELTLRDENRRKRLIKRAGFPTYKTFEGYSYQHVKLPPAFSREELESLPCARQALSGTGQDLPRLSVESRRGEAAQRTLPRE